MRYEQKMLKGVICKNNILEDSVSNECLICSLERTDFEEMSKKFSEHVNFEHNPYNYVFYLYSITKRMLTSSIYDLNADELCCYIGYKEGNPDWIPYKATGFLTNVGLL